MKLLSCFDFINLEMIIYRKRYITQDMIHLLLNEEVSKNSIKETEKNTDFYGRDGRSPVRMNINLILGELEELIFLCKCFNFSINPKSNHDIRTNKSNYNTDFISSGYYVEFQSSFKDIQKVLIKEAKLKGILKLYKNNEPIFLLQQKILENGDTLYKVVNLRNFKKGKEVYRYLNKKEFEVEESGNWKTLKELKIEV